MRYSTTKQGPTSGDRIGGGVAMESALLMELALAAQLHFTEPYTQHDRPAPIGFIDTYAPELAAGVLVADPRLLQAWEEEEAAIARGREYRLARDRRARLFVRD